MKYRLLNDTPNLKAGEVFYLANGAYICDNWQYRYSIDDVENNPEWFELVEERREIKLLAHQPKDSIDGEHIFEIEGTFTKKETELIKAALNGELIDFNTAQAYGGYCWERGREDDSKQSISEWL